VNEIVEAAQAMDLPFPAAFPKAQEDVMSGYSLVDGQYVATGGS